MQYTFEAIEKTFKMADNNMSIMELIQRLNLLGSSDFMNNIIADKDGGLLGKMSADDLTQSGAIADLYKMICQLNSVKKGKSAGVAPTPALIATFVQPGLIKKIYKVIVTYKSDGAESTPFKYAIDGKQEFSGSFGG